MMALPKILAVYLPQFHRTCDNDKWWGEGFTDWETVKTAEAYFEGHLQPRVPVDEEYYDLLTKAVVKRQAALAKEYGIDGFCFYHYYFKDGTLELEKPAEQLLRWKDIDMPFCFNWASEPWIRSWSRIPGNVWSEKYDSVDKEKSSGVLIAQDYGSEKEWEKHFYYLLPFFKDERYIKIDGKPVFLFYSPEDIRCLKDMVHTWRNLAKQEGMEGLYLIGARMGGCNDCLDAALVYEPRHAMNQLNDNKHVNIKNGVRCYDYDNIWDACLNADSVYGMKTFYSGVADYDDTPRRGTSGECFTNVRPEVFRDGLIKLIQKSIASGNEFVFINAWNEWGEGMYLEPDCARGYKMLEAVRAARVQITSSDIKEYAKVTDEKTLEYNSESDRNARKFKELFEIADRWLFLEQEGKFAIKDYLYQNGYRNFAIYGMASLGKHLLIQARKEGIEPAFGIDRYVGQFGEEFKIYRPEEAFPDIDCIIVTAYDYEEIRDMLKQKARGRILYLGDVINSIAE